MSPSLAPALVRELASLPAPDPTGREGLRSFAVARRAVEARWAARLASEEETWRPRIRALAGPAGDPPTWPRIQRALGLVPRRRLIRLQAMGAALAAAGLVVASLLGGPDPRTEWDVMQASATPVPVVIRLDPAAASGEGSSRITPWSFPGGAP